MLRADSVLFAKKTQGKRRIRWGAPGAPTIKLKTPPGAYPQYRTHDIVVSFAHERYRTDRLLHYLGKHVPQPQKSLWSPDTPQPLDRHLFKLTTLDIDAFKYWFGVKRAQLDRNAWKILWRSGLLPPSWWQRNPLVPAPIFEKAQLYKYFLKNRKPDALHRQQKYTDYENSMVRSIEERERDRPKAPWF